jgi:uncharacterized protein YgiM (DUF1202 family)
MLKFLGDSAKDVSSGNLFKPIDRIFAALGNCLLHPIRTLKVAGPILLILFVIGKCSGSSVEEKAAQQTPARTQTVQQVRQYVYVNSDALNMRSGPSASSTIVTVLHRNDQVQFIEDSGNSANWSKIRFGDYEGFVNSSFLRE